MSDCFIECVYNHKLNFEHASFSVLSIMNVFLLLLTAFVFFFGSCINRCHFLQSFFWVRRCSRHKKKNKVPLITNLCPFSMLSSLLFYFIYSSIHSFIHLFIFNRCQKIRQQKQKKRHFKLMWNKTMKRKDKEKRCSTNQRKTKQNKANLN